VHDLKWSLFFDEEPSKVSVLGHMDPRCWESGQLDFSNQTRQTTDKIKIVLFLSFSFSPFSQCGGRISAIFDFRFHLYLN